MPVGPFHGPPQVIASTITRVSIMYTAYTLRRITNTQHSDHLRSSLAMPVRVTYNECIVERLWEEATQMNGLQVKDTRARVGTNPFKNVGSDTTLL